ncbi:hypothetical protein Tco_0258142, partial [Tanacetum coccineum]
KFNKASKDLDQLLGSQITDKSKKKGLGYSAVPSPHPLIYNRPEFKGYGLENSKQESNVVCDNESVFGFLLRLLRNHLLVHSVLFSPKQLKSGFVDKETVFPVNKNVEFTKPKNHEKLVKKSVRYAEMYRSQSLRGNQRN